MKTFENIRFLVFMEKLKIDGSNSVKPFAIDEPGSQTDSSDEHNKTINAADSTKEVLAIQDFDELKIDVDTISNANHSGHHSFPMRSQLKCEWDWDYDKNLEELKNIRILQEQSRK